MARASLAGVAVVTAACASSTGAPAHPSSSLVASAAGACADQQDQVISLGGVDGNVRGQSVPIVAFAPAGSRVEVTATYGGKRVSYPASSSKTLVALCHTAENGAYATVFLARSTGRAVVAARVLDCATCGVISFSTQLTVTKPTTTG
jgi:hypothetical protein